MEKTAAKRILAIDYGAKRAGLAKSDPLGSFAQPVGTFSPDTIREVLQSLMIKDPVEKIIVGYPLNRDGTKNRMTGVIDRFIGELVKAFPDVPVETMDEHGSSRQAAKLLVESGLSRKKRRQKGRLDCTAACLLLQRYLESKS